MGDFDNDGIGVADADIAFDFAERVNIDVQHATVGVFHNRFIDGLFQLADQERLVIQAGKQITAVYFAQFFFQISVAAAGVDDYLSTFFIGIAGRSKAHAHSKRLAFAIDTGAAEFKTLVAVLL